MPRFFLLLPLAFLLTACANAAVYSPKVSRDEIAAEQEVQKGYADTVSKEERIFDAPLSKETKARVKDIFTRIEKAGTEVCQYLDSSQPCEYPFTLITDLEKGAATPNAYADGKGVYVYAGLVNMLQGDEELAFVLSHEYAHNVLSHVNKQTLNTMLGTLAGALGDAVLASQGYSTNNQLARLGQQAGSLSYSSAYEREADYVGLYIVRRAGFDVSKGTEVWRKMAANNPDSIYLATTHPTTAERYIAMQKTIAEIQMMEEAEVPLLPNKVTD